jgi:murein DD-endopeptidase MepM/ murein hydrolase activator NlpD
MSHIFINIPILLLLILTGCSTRQQIQEKLSQEKSVKPGDIKYNKKYQIKPGEVLKIKFPYFFADQKPTLICSEREIDYSIDGEWVEAYVAESYFSKMNHFVCIWKANTEMETVAEFQVRPKKFPSERLNVDLKRVVLSQKDQKRVAIEQKFLNTNYASSPDRPYFKTVFSVPLDSYITSIYGAKRVFNQKKQTQHLGTDFRAAIGVPIPASNAGRVVVARELFYTGLTVTIDHGLGIFTIYGHLSELNAVEGEYVPKGSIIGLAGNTGRTTGPHLHWGVKVNDHFVDGHSLVRSSKIDYPGQVAQE